MNNEEKLRDMLQLARTRLLICMGRMQGCGQVEHPVSLKEIPAWIEDMDAQLAALSETQPMRELHPLDGGNWKYDAVREEVWIDGRKFVPAEPSPAVTAQIVAGQGQRLIEVSMGSVKPSEPMGTCRLNTLPHPEKQCVSDTWEPSAAPEPPTDSFTSDGPISSDPIERCAQIADAVAKSLKRLAEAHPEGEEQAYDCTYGAGVAEDIAAQIRGTRPPTPPPAVAVAEAIALDELLDAMKEAITRYQAAAGDYNRNFWLTTIKAHALVLREDYCDAAASREALSVDERKHVPRDGAYCSCGVLCLTAERWVEHLGGSK